MSRAATAQSSSASLSISMTSTWSPGSLSSPVIGSDGSVGDDMPLTSTKMTATRMVAPAAPVYAREQGRRRRADRNPGDVALCWVQSPHRLEGLRNEEVDRCLDVVRRAEPVDSLRSPLDPRPGHPHP